MAWLGLHYRIRMLDLVQAQRTEAQLQVEAADAAYRGGRGSHADQGHDGGAHQKQFTHRVSFSGTGGGAGERP